MQTPEKRWCLFSSESDALYTLYFPFGLVFIYLNRDLLVIFLCCLLLLQFNTPKK